MVQVERRSAPDVVGASPEGASVADDSGKQPGQSENLSPEKATPVLQARDVPACQRSVLERTILLRDILRGRANNMLEHERPGLKRVLEMLYAWPPARGASS